jgi:hypothetical protein
MGVMPTQTELDLVAVPPVDHLPDVEWLVAIDGQIWHEVTHRMRANMSGHEWDQKSRALTRKMTNAEWERVQRAIREHGLLTSLHNCGFGFTCGMAVYEHAAPIYPGIPIVLRRLLFLESRHLPFKEDRFEAGWAAFSPFTHSDQNAAWLRQYGMEEPKQKGHYDY